MCRDSLGHNARDELHVSKIHRRGPQDRYEYQPEQDGHAGLETHVHTASSLAGGYIKGFEHDSSWDTAAPRFLHVGN